MENLFLYWMIFLSTFVLIFATIGKTWGSNISEFLFANRTLQMVPTGLAIGTHWIWAIALFVGPATAYIWGWIGLLWFLIPNSLALLLIGYILYRIRNRYPQGYSLTAYVKENFSTRVGVLFQFKFIVNAFAALLLAFTAINKLWEFSGLSESINPIYVSLAVGVLTLLFTAKGGIRTSIFTGTVQAVLWTVFVVLCAVFLIGTDLPIYSTGAKNLESVFNPEFLTTFAVAYMIAMSVSSASHGHLWQKGFSMPKENIMPAYTLGAVFFAVFLFTILSMASFAQVNGLEVKAADTSLLLAISTALGGAALLYFSIIFIGQTSTVIDSSMNYFSSLVSLEWLKSEKVWTSRVIMTAFLVAAWLVSWLKLELWTIMLLMSSVRTVMFVPLILHVFNFKLQESTVFWTSAVTIVISVYFAVTAKLDSIAINNMYAMIVAIAIPLVVYLISREINRKMVP
jgi:Na+/proline symporter